MQLCFVFILVFLLFLMYIPSLGSWLLSYLCSGFVCDTVYGGGEVQVGGLTPWSYGGKGRVTD